METFLTRLWVDLNVTASLSESSVSIVTDNPRLTLEQTATRKAKRKILEESNIARRRDRQQRQNSRWSSWTATTTTSPNTASNWNSSRRRVQSDSLLCRPMRASSPDRCSISSSGAGGSATDRGGAPNQAMNSATSSPVLVNATWDDEAYGGAKNQVFLNNSLQKQDSVVLLRNVRLDKQQPRGMAQSGALQLPNAPFGQQNQLQQRKQKDKIKGVLAALGPMAPPSSSSKSNKKKSSPKSSSSSKRSKSKKTSSSNLAGSKTASSYSEQRFMSSSPQQAMVKPLHKTNHQQQGLRVV